ncbi:glycine betaine/L-proline ABC transporter ATP-binding protein [Neorhizobium sp. CSC1952]|uniref:quaternary amine ABC transporter ATP-binding protein n=1 Tax=Neorhizobium sp. CSC1952 TaxID=2978974 RepID=UPI0025A65974|nr:glycine betaine/L-proline ABC transporter ATP-binding protein [Rhizobium sp. CSC1952]WJR66482.1 glycine betaine/L-proline ABC transporter ATP-binding protein [Rhizobium sp. CSC1952]
MASQGIEIKGLYKIFGNRARDYVDAVKAGMTKAELNEKHGHVLGLKDINISMPAGGITVVMGLSGSGKSTLIRHINRLIEPTVGEIVYDGADVCRMNEKDLREFRRHKTAMVFQKFALLPHRTVIENTVYGLDIQGVPRADSVKRGQYWIERVGLAGFEKHYPNQLSGGMQQRVGLARALANDADILLMDEAYSALDPLIRVDMQTVLLDLQAELKKTVVFITHDLDEALRLGDKIAILRDGQVVQQGTGQEIVLSPADDYITAFVKEVNRGRVIRAKTVMRPLEGAPDGLRLAGSATLESAAKRMTEAGQSRAVVTDEDGAPVGTLDLPTIIAAMVTPAGHETEKMAAE